jgi:magnesium chelatase accessory protein
MERAELNQRLDWETEGRDWPNRAHSHFVKAAGLTWHVQQFGKTDSTEFNSKKILLLHGTGSSSHSWRDVAPLLALRYHVLAIDLPGHGFTSMPPSHEQSLNGMARKVAELLRVMSFAPTLVIGHSAGAAVAARMVLDDAVAPLAVLSLNGAFLGFGGLAGQLFSPIARLLAAGSFASRFFAWQATDNSVVEKLVRSTGSVLDPLGMKLYARLVRNPGHVSAALAMMANWDLDALERELPKLTLPVWLVVAENDLTVPPSQATHVARLLPNAHRVSWPMLGHLAHEESPAQFATLVDEVMRSFM